jgi:hypothetical protein
MLIPKGIKPLFDIGRGQLLTWQCVESAQKNAA